jgi:hypothetical protein
MLPFKFIEFLSLISVSVLEVEEQVLKEWRAGKGCQSFQPAKYYLDTTPSHYWQSFKAGKSFDFREPRYRGPHQYILIH